VAQTGRLHIGLLSAGVAFYGLLAIFPALTALVALWGLVADPDVVAAQLRHYGALVPETAFDVLDAQLESLASGPAETLGWAFLVSTGGALWATRAGVGALIRGVNAAYEVAPRRGLGPTLAALALTLVLIAVALVALGSVVAAPIALGFLPLGHWAGPVLEAARWALGLFSVTFGIALLYRFGPNRPGEGRPVLSFGAVTAVVLWAIVSVGFSTYLSNFGSYDAVYGSLGAVIALLMWFYLSEWVILLGALINAELERDREPQTRTVPRSPAGAG